jgi:hypothetical protein
MAMAFLPRAGPQLCLFGRQVVWNSVAQYRFMPKIWPEAEVNYNVLLRRPKQWQDPGFSHTRHRSRQIPNLASPWLYRWLGRPNRFNPLPYLQPQIHPVRPLPALAAVCAQTGVPKETMKSRHANCSGFTASRHFSLISTS